MVNKPVVLAVVFNRNFQFYFSFLQVSFILLLSSRSLKQFVDEAFKFTGNKLKLIVISIDLVGINYS